MKLVALLLALSLSASAQTTFTDPANLRGERVQPSDGHEAPIDRGALGLAQLLRKLNTRASILNIVAHPDDEDGGMLTLYARGFGARVTDLSLTRGEGGQNFVTGDFEDALGLIRTQELLANDRYTGVSQLFGTEVDFGFSKTKEEAFAKWTHDRVLYDAVRAIRIVRPLVITATFIGNVTDGHGQHQVSGEIAQEAFKAAADPNVFPDQIAEGLLPWQALKIYARVPFADINSKGVFDYATGQYVAARFTNYVTGKVTTTKPPADVTVPEGSNDPLLTVAAANPADIPTLAANPTTPLSYIQFGRIGLSLQRSQISKNMTLPVAGFFNSGYTLYGSVLCNAPATARLPTITPKTCRPDQAPTARPITAQGNALGKQQEDSSRAEGPIQTPNLTTQPNFFTGIDTSLEGIADLAPGARGLFANRWNDFKENVGEAEHTFDPAHPERCAPALAKAKRALEDFQMDVRGAHIPESQRENVLHELLIKHVQLNDALALALNVKLEASATSSNVIVGASVPANVRLSSNPGPLRFLYLAAMNDKLLVEEEPYACVSPGEPQPHGSIAPKPFASPVVRSCLVPGRLAQTISRPYFYRSNIEAPYYQLQNEQLRNAPTTPPALTAWGGLDYEGTDISVGRVVHDGPQPVSIIPPVSITSLPTATVLPNGQTTAQLTATLRTDATTSANINVQSPHNWSIEAKAVPAPANDPTHSIHFYLHATAPMTGPQLFHVTAETPDHHTYTEGFRPVGYPGLILTNYYTPATTRVVPVDLKLPAHVRIAYLPGTGDAVPESLASIGLAPTMITVADLTPTKLANFDTVILGVRAYTANPDLHGPPSQALLDFARSGGNVVVQYETSGLTSADAPYPLSLGGGEK